MNERLLDQVVARVRDRKRLRVGVLLQDAAPPDRVPRRPRRRVQPRLRQQRSGTAPRRPRDSITLAVFLLRMALDRKIVFFEFTGCSKLAVAHGKTIVDESLL